MGTDHVSYGCRDYSDCDRELAFRGQAALDCVWRVLFFVMLARTAVYFIPSGVVPLMVRGGEGLAPEACIDSTRN
jgi:hypothetical protein